MTLHGSHLSERPVTDVADVGFLAGVSPPVTLEDVLLGEGHRTQVTLERSLLAVDSAVFLEVRLLKEPLAALRAHLITDLCVEILVSAEMRQLDEALPTILAFIGPLTCVDSNMVLQAFLFSKSFGAVRTNKRPLSCVFDHVSFEVPLVVELLVTVFTGELLQGVALGRVTELHVFPQCVLVFVGLGTVRTLVHSDLGVGLYVPLEVGDLEEALGTETALVDPVRNLRVTPHVDLV